ncbi:MAG: hypothetical protein KAY32_11460 [Candidatus Eisenbacteria sp.]|nr:hypothetical protein [Candidatus Eisenbacteria bacterium]
MLGKPGGTPPAHRSGRPYHLCGGLAGVFLAALLSLAGCEPYGAPAAPGADTASVSLGAGMTQAQAHLFLYRITSRETGGRLGVGRAFRVEPNRQVRAVLQFTDWDPRRDALIHIMWINPDGKEIYTKEIHVIGEDWASTERREALGRKRIRLEPERGLLEIESRFGIDPIRLEEELHRDPEDRYFKLGTWQVRAYLYRKLLLQTSFELLPEE